MLRYNGISSVGLLRYMREKHEKGDREDPTASDSNILAILTPQTLGKRGPTMRVRPAEQDGVHQNRALAMEAVLNLARCTFWYTRFFNLSFTTLGSLKAFKRLLP